MEPQLSRRHSACDRPIRIIRSEHAIGRRLSSDSFRPWVDSRVFPQPARAFASTIVKGDFVVLPRKRTPHIAIGKVTGPYEHREAAGVARHIRPVHWLQTDIPRSAFKQDLLYRLGAFLTVARIRHGDAERRVAAAAETKTDPGPLGAQEPSEAGPSEETARLDLAGAAHDEIVAHIEARFKGHGMAHLVSGILSAEGWVTKVSQPGADGGRDILAGQGLLGLDEPSLCVQVKSQDSRAGVEVYQALVGAMQTVGAKQGLLVCWGGFTKPTTDEAKAGHFSPNPPKDRDGRREDSGRGWVRELQGRWPGVLG